MFERASQSTDPSDILRGARRGVRDQQLDGLFTSFYSRLPAVRMRCRGGGTPMIAHVIASRVFTKCRASRARWPRRDAGTMPFRPGSCEEIAPRSLLVRFAIATLTVLLPAAAAAGVEGRNPLETAIARAHFGRRESVHKLCTRGDHALVDEHVRIARRRREAELDHLVSKRQRRVLLRPHECWAVVPVLPSDHPVQRETILNLGAMSILSVRGRLSVGVLV